MLAARMSLIKPSPTFAIMGEAQKRKAMGEDVIILAAGEPDFDTPEHIRHGAKIAMDQGMTRYTSVDGLYDLKKAIQSKFLDDNNLSYNFSEIMVSTGGKQVIFNAFMASLNEGDEVIIPAPYWVSYVDIVKLFGGVPVIVECSEAEAFKLSAERLQKALSSKTKWLILGSPSNPTGAVYSKEELMELSHVLEAHSCMIMSDDIYEYLTYEGEFFNIAMIAPSLKSRTLIVNGVSKAYAMTGWRIGYGAGPESLIKAMSTLQSQSTSNACSISQAAAITALTSPRAFLESWKKSFVARRDFCIEKLSNIPALTCLRPEGAFYLYVGCAGVLGKTTADGKILHTDYDFATYLLENYSVAVVPGGAFGLSPFVRISYATSMEELEKACNRIAQGVNALL